MPPKNKKRTCKQQVLYGVYNAEIKEICENIYKTEDLALEYAREILQDANVNNEELDDLYVVQIVPVGRVKAETTEVTVSLDRNDKNLS